MQLNTIRLLTGDFPPAFTFWRDVMRFPVAFGPDTPGAPAGYAYFATGDVGLELMSRDSFVAALDEAPPAPPPTGRQTVLIFKVDDVDITYADLVARGATVVAPPKDRPEWQARTAHLADPDGHLIEIYCQLQ